MMSSFKPYYLAVYRRHGLAPQLLESRDMAYVITDTCTKDELCVQACPVDCIHPKLDEGGFAETPQLYVNPNDCIDCGACIPVCPTNSIYTLDELPSEFSRFIDVNANHYN
jgi:NAD-dependent dihydropyrimidine dehydrogenase PreA subunit